MNVQKKLKLPIIILIVIFLVIAIWSWDFSGKKEMRWGATFSTIQARDLGLKWHIVYGTMIDEIPFEVIRIPIYWYEVEIAPGKYDFSSYDWMIEKAAEKDIEVLPVIGRRVPRWPECHVPDFYNNLSESEMESKILKLIETEIKHFKKYDNIKRWQVDNEPFADFFGDCPDPSEDLVSKQVKLVKSLDSRPIVITESGELSNWRKGSKYADILGTSMYRQTWSETSGWFYYPLPPAYYWIKSELVKTFTDVEKVINTELQAEPWSKGIPLNELNEFDQQYSMDIYQLKKNIKFAKKTGINEHYLWGVEWWYWQGQHNGNWEYWELAKKLTDL